MEVGSEREEKKGHYEENVSQEGENQKGEEDQKEEQPEDQKDVLEEKQEDVKYLVVDTNAIIKGVHLEAMSAQLYTVNEVLNEVRDEKSRNFLATFPLNLQVREPSHDAVQKVVEAAKKFGEYASLSITDLKLVALTYMLEKEIEGTFYLDGGTEKPQKSKTNSQTLEEDDGWITPENVDQVTAQMRAASQDALQRKVGCITTDYGMQSLLMKLNLNVVSVDGLQIKRIKQFVLRCEACFKTFSDMEKKFCAHCGNSTLGRAVVYVTKTGRSFCHPRSRVKLRGTQFPLPKPKGGKDNQNIILAEDQYLIEKKKARAKKKIVDPVFGEKLLTSSVVIGYGKKNPNVSRKKTGKKGGVIT